MNQIERIPTPMPVPFSKAVRAGGNEDQEERHHGERVAEADRQLRGHHEREEDGRANDGCAER